MHAELAGRLARGQLAPPSQTQAERDSLLRAASLAAGPDHGTPSLHAAPAGGFGIPLPFGGPSGRRRERDAAIDAEIHERMARVQRRVDSVVAARRRRADSLVRVADSARRAGGPSR